MADYTTYFRRLILTIGSDVSEAERLHRYIVGLQDTIREHVHMRELATFDEACQMAVRYEAMRKSIYSKAHYQREAKPQITQAVPMELGSLQKQPGKPSPQKKDSCFYCGKSGHFAKECRKKKYDQMHNRLTKGQRRQGPSALQ